MTRLQGTKGFTLLEILLDMVLLVIVAMVIATSMKMLTRRTVSAKDKAFATQKVIQMLDELRSVAYNSPNSAISTLDAYDDGTALNLKLTTSTDVIAPNYGDPLSGNVSGGRFGWKFGRRVSILPIQADPSSRRVTVRVFYNDSATSPTPLVQSVSVISSNRNRNVPTQVFDIYYLALENIPTRWTNNIETARQYIDNFTKDMASNNNGCDFRSHYIKRVSYGRDPFYTPWVNVTKSADQVGAFPWTYIYPGSTMGGDYYSQGYMSGRVYVDGTMQNGTPDASAPLPAGEYTMADQFNHAMRYPDEIAKYTAAYNAAPAGQKPEISLRMLLERMNSDAPSSYYGNIILVNLHGEMLPLVPLRNYSDAAKTPSSTYNNPALATDHRYERVVTHPENLSYLPGNPVRLRVYPYIMTGYEGTAAVNVNDFPPSHTNQVTVAIHANIPTANITVEKITGDNATAYSAWTVDASAVVTPGAITKILLTGVPFRHPCNGASPACTGGGLDQGSRLYGLEYIPCEVGIPGGATFSTANDLTALTPAGPRNTARYRITVAAGSLSSLTPYQIETWLGNSAVAPLPPNLSSTYVWVGTTTVPATERYQFMGDPRHMPYHDVKAYHGYNWYFTSQEVLTGTAPNLYPGFSQVPAALTAPAISGWISDTTGNAARPGPVNVDLPRYYELYRQGLLRMTGVFSNISGVTASYFGLGGEIGLGSIVQALELVWNPNSVLTSQTVNENETATGTFTGSRVVGLWNSGNGGWVSLPWLGELSPDHDWSVWQSTGNLPSISNALPYDYYRANYQDFTTGSAMTPQYEEFNYADGPGGGHGPTANAAERGSASLLNGISSGFFGGMFNHESAPVGTVGSVTIAGSSVALVFNQSFYDPAGFAEKPFTITYPVNAARSPSEWSDPIYSSQRATLDILGLSSYPETYLASGWNAGPGGNYHAEAAVKITSGTQTSYLIGSGLTPTFATNWLDKAGRIAVLSALRAFMRAGAPNNATGRIDPIPRVSLIRPAQSDQYANPTTIPVSWVISWMRWDRQPYTDDYGTNYNPPTTSLYYNVKYSKDGGQTWYFIQDPPTGATATAGVPDRSSAHTTFACTPAAPFCHDWDVSNHTNFDPGSYLVRIEAYRGNSPIQYGYHQQTVYITP